jgi:hypothetical protein
MKRNAEMAKNSNKIAVQAPKERNPFVQHLINRNGGGVHVKSFKAHRAAEKVKLKREIQG